MPSFYKGPHERLATERVYLDVATERVRQESLWGVQDHHPLVWNAILGEEAGEVAKEVAEGTAGKFDHAAYRTELIQTAAVAVAAVESLDRALSAACGPGRIDPWDVPCP